MTRSQVRVAFAILLGATLFVGGMLTERLVVLSPGHQPAAGLQRSGSSVRIDAVAIHGQALILAFHANGDRFAAWQGHNALTLNTINNLAGCLSGINTAPLAQSPCSGWTTGIFVQGTGGFSTALATNTLAPSTCTQANGTCTGWQSTATIDSSITTAFTITLAGAGCGSNEGGPPSTTCNAPFDIINVNPGISVTPGDRVIVTITFTVS